nr:hypothetical protein [Tanacetum cinerariifolium]
SMTDMSDPSGQAPAVGLPVHDKEKGKMDDKGKGKIDDLVDAVEKGKSKLMVSEKGTKKENVDLVDALDLQNRIKKLSEILILMLRLGCLRRDPLLPLPQDQELPLLPQDLDLIASAFNAQPAASRGYKKIAMIGCVLSLRAPNDPNALPPLTIRKRKP